MRGIVIGAIVTAVLGAQDRSDSVLTGELTRGVVVVKFRPGSRAGASAAYALWRAESEVAEFSKRLAVQPPKRVVLKLYDDVEELTTTTGVKGTGGFSAVDTSHVPFDNDQTRAHELIHVIATQIPKAGDEPRSLFFAEGLANALLVYVTQVHCHDVAAFWRKEGGLPKLVDLVGEKDFYAWQAAHPTTPGYDIAASYMLHLLDAHGVEKTKRYYGGAKPESAFGASLSEIERAWHKTLDARKPSAELITLLRRRRGDAASFEPAASARGVPADVLGNPKDWRSLTQASMKPSSGGKWERHGAVFRGTTAKGADWATVQLGDDAYGDCVVRATLKTAAGSCGQIRLGERCQAMVVANGAFVFDRGAALAAEPGQGVGDRTSIDFIMRRKGGKLALWLDGVRVFETAVSADAAPISLGVAGEGCSFEDVRVRRL